MNDLMVNATDLNAMMHYANMLAKSTLIPVSYQNNPANLLVALSMGRELKIPPMQAINGINVINGKASVSPQLMLAIIYNRVPNAIIDVRIDHTAKTVVVRMSRDKDDKQVSESVWTMERAKLMGLANKDNWLKQPVTMLKWRAVAEVARERFPDVIMGLYTTEEMAPDDVMVDESGNVVVIDKKAAVVQKEPTPLDRLRLLVRDRMKSGVSQQKLANLFKIIFPINDLADLALVEENYIIEMIKLLEEQNEIFEEKSGQ